ncbi:hypothetical protein BH09PAT4_BH09PAT4_03340 [soil metagenome]
MMKIAKNTLLTRLAGLIGISLLILLAIPGSASAGSFNQRFACVDESSDIKITTNKSKHTATVVCSSGSKIDYLMNDDVEPTNMVKATCKGSDNVGTKVDTPNKPVKYIQFYCVKGAPEHTTRTKTTPTLKDVTSSMGSTDTSSDVTDGTDPALGSTVACTKSSCPLITKYVNPAIAVLSALVGIVAVIAIVVGGIQVTTSAGDPQKSAAGKNHIRNAVIGVVSYVFLYAFLQWVIPGGSI